MTSFNSMTISLKWMCSVWVSVAVFCFAVVSITPSSALAGYPERPVRIVLPFGTGGVSDIAARLLSEHLEKELGQRFLVENRPGANSAVAANAVLAAGNDCYTLFNMGASATIRRTLMPNQPNDIDRFEPISPVAKFGMIVVSSPGSKFKSIQDVVAFAKENPGQLNIGSVARGSTQNLSAELFKSMAGIKAMIVPFKKSPELMGAVARNEVDIAFEMLPGAKSAIAAGQVIPIATTMSTRSRIYPDLPTVEEGGVKPFDASSWNCYMVPNGAPKDIVNKLNAAIQKVLNKPEVQEKMLSFGLEPFLGTPETVSKAFESDTKKWRDVIAEAGVPIKK